MELRDLLTVDLETLTPVEAEFVADDITATLARGGLDGDKQHKLKTLLVEARRKALAPKPDTRTRVAQLIEEAEKRGDERTARVLTQSMVDADVAAADRAERERGVAEAAKKAHDAANAADAAELERQEQELISSRTQELLYAHGNSHGYTEAKAREQATQEIAGRRKF